MAKRFPTVSWAKGANIYEVNVRQYTREGTFEAFRQHLPRLQEMGVEIIWLMPMTPISHEKRQGTLGSYYACSSYTDINPEFGSLEDFKHLVNEVHQRGMKLIIDWVANHTGWDHHWRTEHPEWYEKNELGEFYDENGWIDVIDLNYSQSEMRTEMISAMQYWVGECDIDGFRCDMAHLVPLDFWIDARSSSDHLKDLYWLAETDNNEYHEVFDTTYAWSWMHRSEQFFKGNISLQEFRREILQLNALPEDCYKMLFTANHDENSWNGTEYEKYGDAAKMLAVFCATWKAMPLIYSGQEIPNNKRLQFFDKDQLEWSNGAALQEFYQTLLQARDSSSALKYGSIEILQTDQDDKVIAFLREYQGREVVVVLNFTSEEKLRVTISHPSFHGTFESLFSGLHYDFFNEMQFEVDPWGWLVYRK